MIRFSPNPNRAHLIRWFEWGDEAFEEARRQDKPVLLFLGAFWCGLCQRMDESALSDDENIALVNGSFIAVRAENAQRPDVDVRYSQNGWPTIAFLSPEGEDLGGVNFLSAEDFGRTLKQVHVFYRERGEEWKDRVARAYREASHKRVPGRAMAPAGTGGVEEISRVVMGLADSDQGGYGAENKFPHPEADEFLLDRYESTGERRYLEHVRLTLDRMREARIRDRGEGGFFRYSSKRDWSEPHREKLLCDQAGILAVCLRLFSFTRLPAYREMAEGIIDYLDSRLSDRRATAFYGCQDYIRLRPGAEEFFSVIDDWLYTDANAQAASAYLQAAFVLERPDCAERALRTLAFLWERCRQSEGDMAHYFDGAPRVAGLLVDQLTMGLALLRGYEATADPLHLGRAKELAEHVLAGFRNSEGGYYDVRLPGPARLRFRLTLLEQNGAAARFLLKLAEKTKEKRYRDAALWALSAFAENFATYGIHAAGFGRALMLAASMR